MTPKQQLFIREYLIDLNATQAAIRAGYSVKTANEQAAQMLARRDIADAIDTLMADRSVKIGISAERVLSEISVMAFYDPAEIMVEIGKADPELADGVSISDDGKIYGLRGPNDIRRLTENVRRAIVGWGYDRNQNFSVKLADKSKALDQLARHLSLYNDRIEVTSVDGLADRLNRIAAREEDAPARSAQKPVAAPANPLAGPSQESAQNATEQPASESDDAKEVKDPIGAAEIIAAAPARFYRAVLPPEPEWPAQDDGKIDCDYDPTRGNYNL
ncbi:terminase small subunit [Rhizobium sp. AB2/73]|uniref:terminase small subunit n=1 Tax=Rhizobium sp. AB2/73 TaxID=2795216 RepID=UPI000DDE51EE|nr:terminase small subunit [Rhizobium sp. AB2/73]QYA11718.1 terminase small subunit [Rhizobium sp. AB2/73]UEQ82352.1 terminase small subunit [Rhizobium sp. AB2/73]